MSRSAVPILVLSLSILPLPSFAQTPVGPAFAAALQEKLDSCANTWNVPGISATILLPGDRYWNGASGVANIYTEQPMDTAFLFQQASVTKLFTSTLIMQLVSEGELALDDTVGAFLPFIMNVPQNIKVRHLLKHRSGLAEFLQDPDAFNAWLLTPNAIWEPQDVIATFGNDPTFPQGTAFGYCNTNYLLLGMLVEAITGQSYADAVRERILDPLGLSSTVFRPYEALPGPLVPGWSSLSQANTYTDDMTSFLGPCFASMVFAAGALVSRPWDVARFNRALFSGQLLPQAWMDTMRVCTNVNMGTYATGYGFGTMRYQIGGRTYFGHAGDINGFTQLTIHDQPDSVTLTISINRNDAQRGPIAAALLAVVFDQLAVGVAEGSTDPGPRLYPQPASERVYITHTASSGPCTYEVLNTQGTIVLRATRSVENTTELDVTGLPSGGYLVRCIQHDAVITRTLIVQR